MISIDEIPQGERLQLFSAMVKSRIGAVPIELPPYDFALNFADELVQPGQAATVQVCPQLKGRLGRLVIFDSVAEVKDSSLKLTSRDVVVGRLWWKKTLRVAEEKKYDSTKIINVPRSSWLVLGVFNGNKPVYPTYANMPGDLFAPDSKLGMDQPCEPALFVTLQIRNVGAVAATFNAAVLGTRRI